MLNTRVVVAVALLGLSLTGCELFKPKPKNEPAPANDQPAAPPPAAYVPAAPAKVDFGAGCTVGWCVTQEYDMSGTKQTVSWAIVGDAGQSWQVEHVAMGLPAGSILGLTVNKADGKVTRAVIGKKGEAGKEHPIGPLAESTVTAVEENVTIEIGTFPAKKTDNGGGNMSWVGNGGDLNGVLLKTTGAGAMELSAKPSSEYVPTGSTSLAVTTYTYSNGMKMLVTNDRIVAAFFPYEVGKRGMFGMETTGMKSKIVSVGSSAKPDLMW